MPFIIIALYGQRVLKIHTRLIIFHILVKILQELLEINFLSILIFRYGIFQKIHGWRTCKSRIQMI